ALWTPRNTVENGAGNGRGDATHRFALPETRPRPLAGRFVRPAPDSVRPECFMMRSRRTLIPIAATLLIHNLQGHDRPTSPVPPLPRQNQSVSGNPREAG